MTTPRKILPSEIILESYQRNGGNKTATAKELGIDRQTLRNCLSLYGASDKPVVGGAVKQLKNNVLPLPEPGQVRRYLLSCAQNNTRVVSSFLKNLEAYRDWLGDCQIMVSRFTYNKNQYLNAKDQKPGTISSYDADECWYDPAILPYICDDVEKHGTRRWQLAPDLFWCSEMNILPTATKPLSDLKTYTGSASSIFPHAKIAMEAVPSMPGTQTKHIYTTGCLTARNYIQKKAGVKAEFHHQFGALLVEVNSDGDWWVRQLNADKKGDFFDCPGGKVVKVTGGQVTEGHRLEAINWGDVHVEELPESRKQSYWGDKGIIDQLLPKYQFFHDTLSFRSRSHHEMKSFSKMLEKHVNGQESVEQELMRTVAFLSDSHRENVSTIVIRSNHDTHGEKWLDTADYRSDMVNVQVFLEAQLDRVKAIKAGKASDWMFFEWASKRYGGPSTVRFLKTDESFVICQKSGHPIECSLHGDIGPNGSRGTTSSLSTIGCKINKGHSHAAEIRDGVYSAGACSLDHGYNFGPTSWSISHILTYPNGKRTIVTERSDRLWA